MNDRGFVEVNDRQQTADPFLDAAKLRRYLQETEHVFVAYGGRQMRYRSTPDFRWQYLDYLAPPD